MKIIKTFIKRIVPKKYHNKISGVYNYLKSLYFFGFRYQCNFCKGHFRRLFPTGLKNDIALSLIGGGYRYSLCPRCHSSDRERLIYWYVANKTNILRSQETVTLLHIAPEKNLEKVFKTSFNIEYINGDINLLAADRKIDITDINFGDNYFDFIICNHVLEHTQDDKKAMRELFRVLNPGGFAILQVPISKKLTETFEDFSITSPEEKEKHFGQKDHVRIYGKDYKERLENVGFGVELYDIKKDLSAEEIKRYGLNMEEILYIGRKL